MSQKRKLKTERTLDNVVAAICRCGGVAELKDNNRSCFQKQKRQLYKRR